MFTIMNYSESSESVLYGFAAVQYYLPCFNGGPQFVKFLNRKLQNCLADIYCGLVCYRRPAERLGSCVYAIILHRLSYFQHQPFSNFYFALNFTGRICICTNCELNMYCLLLINLAVTM